ncbi:hypothetical protein ABT083_01230 [Streptomyces goshikiensis]|uniref:hypothetical protein n=1 Tax=Streptomyces goshikiensis TaxID=1942 RepID=UPI00332075CE
MLLPSALPPAAAPAVAPAVAPALAPARDRDRDRDLHDAALAVWRSLARALYVLAAAPGAETGPPAARAAALYDLSSALLLQGGPAFREPVPGALRAALAGHPGAPALDPLLRAVKDHARVRVAVLRPAAPGRGRPETDLPAEPRPVSPARLAGMLRRPETDLPAEPRPVSPARLAGLLRRCADGLGAGGPAPLPPGCPDRFAGLGREEFARLAAALAPYDGEPPAPIADGPAVAPTR